MIPFEELGCTQELRAQFEAGAHSACELGRVTSLDRGYPLVNTEHQELRAELATTIKKSDDSIVAVGDWVALAQPESHEKAIIEEILPRRTEIARVKRVGREKQVRRQVLAANVDTVFICQSLSGDGLDERLLLRQAVAVYGCGARPVVVLTKGDLVGEAGVAAAVECVHGFDPQLVVLAIASAQGVGVEDVRAQCAPGTTSLLLGESGVGKSTLVNGLVGFELLATSEVRSSDDKGRHTTVARRMVQIPGGGLMIDAPGLRTLQLLDVERSARAAFPDVYERATRCRFRDCTHESEPGCAVREGVAPARLEAYRSILRQR